MNAARSYACALEQCSKRDSLAPAESAVFCISIRGRSAVWRKRLVSQPLVESAVYWHRISDYSSDVLAARVAARLAQPLIRPSMHVII